VGRLGKLLALCLLGRARFGARPELDQLSHAAASRRDDGRAQPLPVLVTERVDEYPREPGTAVLGSVQSGPVGRLECLQIGVVYQILGVGLL
jgi:hypothetical protein